jgi:hypothetical protein
MLPLNDQLFLAEIASDVLGNGYRFKLKVAQPMAENAGSGWRSWMHRCVFEMQGLAIFYDYPANDTPFLFETVRLSRLRAVACEQLCLNSYLR